MRVHTGCCFAAAALLAGCGFYEKPSAADAAEAVESFLAAAYARDCGGRVEVRRLTVSRVGEYRADYDGFPVFAAVELGCADGTALPHLAARSGRDDVVAVVKRAPPLMRLTAFLPPRLRTERERDETRVEAAETRGMPR
ncbi:MAG: hypothetical protein MUE39_01050 [Gammaproteobacteria bacterium]|nr:hypothetical protein [Gammaproteobacteria bacterium]